MDVLDGWHIAVCWRGPNSRVSREGEASRLLRWQRCARISSASAVPRPPSVVGLGEPGTTCHDGARACPDLGHSFVESLWDGV